MLEVTITAALSLPTDRVYTADVSISPRLARTMTRVGLSRVNRARNVTELSSRIYTAHVKDREETIFIALHVSELRMFIIWWLKPSRRIRKPVRQ